MQGGPVRRAAQAQDAAQVGQVGQQLGDAAVVVLGEDFEDQAGEELGLGILLGTVLVVVVAQGRLPGG